MPKIILVGDINVYDKEVFRQFGAYVSSIYLNMYRFWLHIELVCLVLIAILRGFVPVVIVKQLGPTIVTTKYGKLRGSLVEFPKDSYIPLSPVEAYLGVQYASLHNGNLRFMRPSSPNERWNNIHSATDFRPVCPQQHIRAKHLLKHLPEGSVEWMMRVTSFASIQKEDCLNLNLYVPIRGTFLACIFRNF